MILCVLTLALSFPIALSHDKYVNFRNRRTLLLPPPAGHPKKSLPFVIRVPYAKVVTSNPLFSHSISWKAKQGTGTTAAVASVKSASDDQQTQSPPPPAAAADVEVTQFHSQGTNGQVIFGFNSPDQMRIETRDADGAVHGTYSYLDPYGQVIKRQYWDTGAGFHVASNSYPMSNGAFSLQSQRKTSPYTPEVQAARDLHFQLYQQALASLLPTPAATPPPSHAGLQEDRLLQRQNNSASVDLTNNITKPAIATNDDDNDDDGDDTTRPITSSSIDVASASASASNVNVNVNANANDLSVNILQPNAENGTIIIQNPEYLRISWMTENKRYRIDLYNQTGSWKANGAVASPNFVNVTTSTAIIQAGQ